MFAHMWEESCKLVGAMERITATESHRIRNLIRNLSDQ